MDNDAVIDQRTLNTLRDSVLAPRIPEYCSHLRLGRYAENTRRVYLRCVAHFACWLTTEQLGLGRRWSRDGWAWSTDVRCRCRVSVRLRQAEARPILDDLEAWLQAQLTKVSGKSALAKAIRYGMRGQWRCPREVVARCRMQSSGSCARGRS